MPDFDADVLVVGAGPAGATTGLALATYGVRVHMITRYGWLSNSPRAHITNQRTMEVLRDLGVEDEASGRGTDWEHMGDTLFMTSFAGREIARIRAWGTGDRRHGDYVKASPCGMVDLPQPLMESVLVRNAAERGATIAFNTEYLAHRQDASGVTVTLRDRLSGREFQVRTQYLVGADGARSQVLADAGLEVTGQMGRGSTAYVRFRADLTRYAAHRPSILYWVLTPLADYGEIGMGLLRAVRPWTEWIVGWGFDPADGDPDFSDESVTERIRAYVGDPHLEPEIGAASTWQVNQAYAPVYSSGRVFCAGDAVHRHPPSGGLGSNTGIQDAYNLAWKLAYVLRGHAAPSLLETYTAERAPIGEQIVIRANTSRLEFGPINDTLRVEGAADPVAAALAKLADPSPEGARTRDALARALEVKHFEFNAHGVEMNQRYVSDAVIVDDAQPEIFARDRELYAQPTTRPGAKLPHAWLAGSDGRRLSTLDIVGRGRFTLVTGQSGTAWQDAARQLDLPWLSVVIIGAPGAEDLYREWHRVREIDDAGALVVRPDGYIAWRHTQSVWAVDEALAALRDVIADVLGRSLVADAR